MAATANPAPAAKDSARAGTRDRIDALRRRYGAVRAASERLAEPLSDEDCAIQSMDDASPTKWHLAHTSWYFETFVLEPEIPGYRPFHPHFRVLFNSYYNGVGRQYPRPQRGLLSRPGRAEVLDYRRHVDAGMERLFDATSLDAPRLDVVELGTHHEQQHQELILTDLKHMLSFNPLHPTYREAEAPAAESAPPLSWTSHAGGVQAIGHRGSGFAFDNEGPRHQLYLEPFELASRPVTCREYLEFIGDGGYDEPAHWLADGWAAAQQQGWRAPLYWEDSEEGWLCHTLHGTRAACSDDAVCHLSYYEADAYARWSGYRLPTEGEWECAARDVAVEGRFVEDGRLHPGVARGGAPAQLFGDVWEWTRSPYVPYPGFRAAPGAIGEYNGKFMSNQLVLRGGSCATPRSHIRATYRNFFYPDDRWQFSGLRLARDV